MEQTFNNDSDSQSLDSSQQISQNVADTQHQVNQLATVGNSNTQQHSVNTQGESLGSQSVKFVPDGVKQDITQVANRGDYNHQSIHKSEHSVNIYFDSKLTDLISKVSPDSEQEKPLNDNLTDLTTELQIHNERYPDFISSELQEEYRKKLEENRLIFISSPDQEISWQVGCALASNIRTHNKRLLSGQKSSFKYFDAISIDTLLNQSVGGDESTVFIVDTGELQTFLDSVTVRHSKVISIRNALRSNHKFCICLVEPQALQVTLKASRAEKLFFDCWQIPIRITQDFEDSDYQNKQFDGLVSQFQIGNYLTKIVLFTASFFPQLSLNDFEKIVCLLLHNEPKPINVKKNDNTEVIDEFKNQISVIIEGEKIIINKSNLAANNLVLKEIHDNNIGSTNDSFNWILDDILDSCHLTFIQSGNSGKVIDFAFPGLREKLIEYFEKKYAFINQQFQTLIKLNFLVDTSSKISKYTRDISTKMMLYSDEEEYRKKWLEDTIFSILIAENKSQSPKLKAYQFNCISDLLREFLNHSELKNLVNQILEELIASRQHNAVLEIAKRLRFAPQFDEMYWFKQLIARGTESVQLETYRTLSIQLKQSNSRFYEILEEIKTWLPALDRSPGSRLNQFALQLLPEYILGMLEKFESNTWNISTVFTHPLFNGLRNNDTALARAELLVSWLLHPGFNSVTGKDIDSMELVAISIFPKLLTILDYAKDKNQHQSEFKVVENYLIQAIVNVADFYQRETGIKYKQSLLRYWQGWLDYLKIQINHLKAIQEHRLANKWNRERNFVRRLIREFRELSC